MKLKTILRGAVIIGAVITIVYMLTNRFTVSDKDDADKTPRLVQSTLAPAPSASTETEDVNESLTGYDYIDQGLANLGDSFVTGGNLQVTVNSISLFTNVFTAGWEMEDFDKYTVVIIDSEDYSDSRLLDCIDPNTGALDEGLTMVVAEITVTNLNTESKTFGPSADVWGNNVMVLVNPVVWDGNTENRVALPACEPAACSCEKPIAGQRTWVYIAPGDAVSYRLAFIADDYVRLENGYLSEDFYPSEGQIYFPLTLAE